MAKQVILIILLSVLSIMFKSQLSAGLDAIVGVHNLLATKLNLIFADDDVGRLIQDMISLLVIPLLCGAFVTAGFWLVTREAMPHMMGVIWMLWLVLVVTMVAQDGMIPSSASARTRVSMHNARSIHHHQPHVMTAMR